jgi:hypothetical protein
MGGFHRFREAIVVEEGGMPVGLDEEEPAELRPVANRVDVKVCKIPQVRRVGEENRTGRPETFKEPSPSFPAAL